MPEARYMVQSEHVRGEKRVYYVIDRAVWHGPGSAFLSSKKACTRTTTSKTTAARWEDRLNDGKAPYRGWGLS